jgi:hypothetical protein
VGLDETFVVEEGGWGRTVFAAAVDLGGGDLF